MALIALGRFPGRAWRALWRPAQVAALILAVPLVMAAIAFLPILAAGPSLPAFLKGGLTLPAAAALVFIRRRRDVVGYTLLALYGCALLVMAAVGVDQHDVAFDLSLFAMLALSGWLFVPFVRDWRVTLRAPRRADLLRARVRLRAAGAVPPGFETGRRDRILGIAAFAIGALIAIAAVGQPARAEFALRVPAIFCDAVFGGLAMWILARRLGGELAGAAAAFAWMCASVRWEFASVQDAGVSPTFLVPGLAVLALELRTRRLADGRMVASILAGLLLIASVWWPLLALSAALVVTAVLFAFDEARTARWTALAIAACAFSLAISAAVAGRADRLLGAQTAFMDPAHAAVACASGCDGALPWEFLYPSSFASAYESLVSDLFATTQHWGNYQVYAIAPGWAQLVLAAAGMVALYRSGRRATVRAALLAIVAGIALALPSHYLGLGLPSFARVLTAIVPSFEFGAQFAIVAAFFVALMAGPGFAEIVRSTEGSRRALALVVVGSFVALDVVELPVHGHPGTVLGATGAALAPSADGSRVKVAFYPMLTADFGAEYGDLVHAARERNLDLINASDDAGAVANLSAPDAFARLRARGVRYAVVALGDYPRRAEILRAGHIVLPEDEDWDTAAWVAPDPATLARPGITTRTDGSGTLILGL